MSATNFSSIQASGIVVSGGYAKRLFVGTPSAGYLTGVRGDSYDKPKATLAAAFHANYVDPESRGTHILVRRGSAENVSAADYFSAIGSKTNVTIEGEGDNPNEWPSLTWTAAGSTWAFDTANITVRRMKLFLAGPHAAGDALTVTGAIAVSAAGCRIEDCLIYAGFDANQLSTLPIATAAGGSFFSFQRNKCLSLVAAPVTTMVRLVAADDAVIKDNEIDCATSGTTVGAIQALTTASLRVNIENNRVKNILASSVACITGMTGLTGWIHENKLRCMGAFSEADHINTPGSTQLFNNEVVDADGLRGVAAGTVSS